jgi:hypothetical protein
MIEKEIASASCNIWWEKFIKFKRNCAFQIQREMVDTITNNLAKNNPFWRQVVS